MLLSLGLLVSGFVLGLFYSRALCEDPASGKACIGCSKSIELCSNSIAVAA